MASPRDVSGGRAGRSCRARRAGGLTDGEVTAVTLTFDPELLGGAIPLSLTAVGEEFTALVMQGDVTGYGLDDWRERLRSDMADFVAESRFGWGEDRGV